MFLGDCWKIQREGESSKGLLRDIHLKKATRRRRSDAWWRRAMARTWAEGKMNNARARTSRLMDGASGAWSCLFHQLPSLVS